MNDSVQLNWPYCLESVEVYIDPQSEGELIRDCEVCCRPWWLQVSRDEERNPSVRVFRA